jgi:hypothetical protein
MSESPTTTADFIAMMKRGQDDENNNYPFRCPVPSCSYACKTNRNLCSHIVDEAHANDLPLVDNSILLQRNLHVCTHCNAFCSQNAASLDAHITSEHCPYRESINTVLLATTFSDFKIDQVKWKSTLKWIMDLEITPLLFRSNVYGKIRKPSS